MKSWDQEVFAVFLIFAMLIGLVVVMIAISYRTMVDFADHCHEQGLQVIWIDSNVLCLDDGRLVEIAD